MLARHYNKFRQLNKYLEIVADCLPLLEEPAGGGPLNIIDFGSGKAYLTFALYHYLAHVLERDIKIIGLDLKEEVVAFCKEIAADPGYRDLTFRHGGYSGLYCARQGRSCSFASCLRYRDRSCFESGREVGGPR